MEKGGRFLRFVSIWLLRIGALYLICQLIMGNIKVSPIFIIILAACGCDILGEVFGITKKKK